MDVPTDGRMRPKPGWLVPSGPVGVGGGREDGGDGAARLLKSMYGGVKQCLRPHKSTHHVRKCDFTTKIALF